MNKPATFVRVCGTLGIILATTVSDGARAAEDPANYPSHAIRMVVPFAPGGASDFVARVLQPRLSALIGHQVVVENRAGAAGNIGMDAAARAQPDGYTIFLGNVGTISINPTLFRDLRVKPEKDFDPVSLVADTPGILIANMKFPPNTVKEFVDYAKQNPGKVNFASPGSGSLNRLEMELFRKNIGLDMVHIPFKGGAGPAVTDLLGGHVEVMFTTISSAISHVKAGKLKAYAVTTRERVPSLPDVPTMIEAGYSNHVTSSWQGILVPAKTPKAIIDKLYSAVTKAVEDPDIRSRMLEGGVLAVSSKSPEEFAAYILTESKRWGDAVKETGAQPD
jgi:tripartite-type tricarboxylate transporter receptor subunit TctC